VTHGSNELGRTTGARSINQTVALVFGAVYTVVAIIGFFLAKTFATNDPKNGDIVGLFQVNHLHNIVHLLIGVGLIAASRAHSTARNANLAVGVTYLVVFVLGLFLLHSSANILAVNGPDNVLHLVSGALLAGVALAMDKDRAPRTA
jgi:glucose uptake protein GlcU